VTDYPYFDCEPKPGGTYDRIQYVLVIANADGIPRRLVVRYRGHPVERLSVQLEEVRTDVSGCVQRYDDAHGFLRKHIPGRPEPDGMHAERFDHVPVRQRTAFADAEIQRRYSEWEAGVFGLERGSS